MDDPHGTIPAKGNKQNIYSFTCKKGKELSEYRIRKIFQKIAEMSTAGEKITALEIENCKIRYSEAKYLAACAIKHKLIGLVIPHNDTYSLVRNADCKEIPPRPWRAQKEKTKKRKTTSTRNPNYMLRRHEQHLNFDPNQHGSSGYTYPFTGKSNLVGNTGGF